MAFRSQKPCVTTYTNKSKQKVEEGAHLNVCMQRPSTECNKYSEEAEVTFKILKESDTVCM